MLCAKFEKDFNDKMASMDERDCARFQFQMDFWRIVDILQAPIPIMFEKRELKLCQAKLLLMANYGVYSRHQMKYTSGILRDVNSGNAKNCVCP